MTVGNPHTRTPAAPTRPLLTYLLGSLELAATENTFRRLVYEVSGGGCPCLLLCEHSPGISVGRDGSRAHIRLTSDELTSLRWNVQWLARGGGVLLHAPGQLACYPVFSLAELGLTPAGYVAVLGELAVELFRSFGVTAHFDSERPGVRVGSRRAAHIGVAIHSGVTTFGLVVNVAPDLELFRDLDCDGDPLPMTSLQRECPTRVRPQAVRQRLMELVAARFGFERLSVLHHHPTFFPKPTRHAISHRH